MTLATDADIRAELQANAFAVVRAEALHVSPDLLPAWEALRAEYPSLPPDEYLPGGGHYRFRRWGRVWFLPLTGEMIPLPPADYFQSREDNKVTGGMIRKFAPLLPGNVENFIGSALGDIIISGSFVSRSYLVAMPCWENRTCHTYGA